MHKMVLRLSSIQTHSYATVCHTYICMKVSQGFPCCRQPGTTLKGSPRKIEKAAISREVQAMIGHPIDRSFKEMVRHRNLSDFPVTIQDVYNALAIFGPDLAGVCGKTVRCRIEILQTYFLHIPKYFYVLHTFFTLTDYVVLVNGVAFLKNLSRDIRMFSSETFNYLAAPMIRISLKKADRIYA